MAAILKEIRQAIPKPPRLLNTAAYARVSCGKDAMIQSLAAQVSYYRSYIQNHSGWAFAGVYADEALTGTKDNRPEFQRLLADCRAGKIDMVIVKSISRFARNTVTLLETVRELKTLGVDIYFENENIHALSADGELMLTLIAAVAQEESRSVSENCKWRIRKQYAQGQAGFSNAYGYRIENGKPIIDPVEAQVVRFIFDSHNQGIGYARIAKCLDGLGVAPPSTSAWNPLTIRYIISNERYAGHLVLQKTFVEDHLTKKRRVNRGELDQVYVECAFPAIVSPPVFEQAQSVSSKNTERFTSDTTHEMTTLFRGLIICGKCEKPYKRKVAHGTASWNCGTFLRKGKAYCHGKQIPEDILLDVLGDMLGDDCRLKDQSSTEGGGAHEPFGDLRRIMVPAPNHLVFEFSGGELIERTWTDRSRRESWSEAAREHARKKTKERWAK